MNAKDLLEIFNGINARIAEDSDRLYLLEQVLREALVIMLDGAITLTRAVDMRSALDADRLDSDCKEIGRLMDKMDHYGEEK